PYVYLTEERRWIPRHTVLLNARLCLEDRPEIAVFHNEFDTWKTNCIDCHTTHGQPEPVDQAGLPSPVARVAEFGIACEACHRPAGVPDPVESGSFWSDGMSRATGREFSVMMESPCYKRGEMSCLSCHEMHQKQGDPRKRKEWAAGQLKRGMDGNRACVQCHNQ